MRSLIDFGEPDAWECKQVLEETKEGFFQKTVILVPNQIVAGIPKDRIKFLIELSCPSIFDLETSEVLVKNKNFDNTYFRYTFEGCFSLGEGLNFTGEYTYRLEIDICAGQCRIFPVSNFSISEFEIYQGILLARALATTLPCSLILYGALHNTEFVMEEWEKAAPT